MASEQSDDKAGERSPNEERAGSPWLLLARGALENFGLSSVAKFIEGRDLDRPAELVEELKEQGEELWLRAMQRWEAAARDIADELLDVATDDAAGASEEDDQEGEPEARRSRRASRIDIVEALAKSVVEKVVDVSMERGDEARERAASARRATEAAKERTLSLMERVSNAAFSDAWSSFAPKKEGEDSSADGDTDDE